MKAKVSVGPLEDKNENIICNDTKNGSLVKSGVTQGSVLRSLLFTIHINDIDDNIASHTLKFADDKDF